MRLSQGPRSLRSTTCRASSARVGRELALGPGEAHCLAVVIAERAARDDAARRGVYDVLLLIALVVGVVTLVPRFRRRVTSAVMPPQLMMATSAWIWEKAATASGPPSAEAPCGCWAWP